MNKKSLAVIIAILIIGVVSSLWWTSHKAPPAPSHEIAMEGGESIGTWDFTGAYTGHPDLEAKARAEITRLIGLIGSGKYPDYQLYVGIANQYDLIGDGKNELLYLEKALGISTQSGLAWNNAGALFDRLGAYKTARAAYETAVTVQPTVQYLTSYVDFLERRFPGDPQIQVLKKVLGQGVYEPVR